MNPSLRELQTILANHVRVLSKQLDDVTDADEAKKILDEMQEFNHRVTLVGGLLFRQQSQTLDQKVEAIRRGQGAVNRAIKNITDLANMLQVVSDYLAVVDEVIDLAKAL